jgi:hypothetical protein
MHSEATRRTYAKNLLIAIALAAAAILSCPASALAATSPEGFEYTSELGSVTITGYSGAGGDIETPTAIAATPVKAIASDAFEYNASITSVKVSDGVTSIGERAFNDCTGLTSVSLPSSLVSIGTCAFYDCSRLESVALPSSLESLGNYAFAFCYSLKSASIPGYITGWGIGTFSHSDALETVTVADGATRVPNSTFRDCSSLYEVSLPESVQTIGDDAFSGCTMLAYIDLTHVVTFGESSFSNTAVASLDLASATQIGEKAFLGSAHIGTLSMPKVQAVGAEAFASSENKPLVVEGESGESGATGGDGDGTGGDGAGAETSAAEAVSADAASTGAVTAEVFSADAASGEIIIASSDGQAGFATIADEPCEIYLPSTLRSIGDQAFAVSSSVQMSVTVDEQNSTYQSVDGLVYSKDGASLVLVPTGYAQISPELVVAEGTTRISPHAAMNVCGVTSVVLPETLTEVGTGAFQNALDISSVNFPEGLTQIPDYAFSGNAFTSIDIPGTVRSIGKSAFADSSSASPVQVNVGEGVQTIGEKAFSSSNGANIQLPSTLSSLNPQMISGMLNASVSVAEGGSYKMGPDGHSILTADGSTLVLVFGLQDVGADQEVLSEVTDTAESNDAQLSDSAEGAQATEEAHTTDESAAESQDAGTSTEVEAAASDAQAAPEAEAGDDAAQAETAEPQTDEAASDASAQASETEALADAASALSAAQALAEYTVPDGVTTIGARAFCATSLTQLNVPASVSVVREKSIAYEDAALSTSGDYVNTSLKIIAPEASKALIDYAKTNELAVFTGEPVVSAERFSLEAGQTAKFTLSGSVSDLLLYASSDNSVVSVDSDGTVRAHAGGEADIFACEGTVCFSAHVTVSGEAASNPYAGYAVLTSTDQSKQWAQDDAEYNGGNHPSKLDTPATFAYTGNSYTLINAYLSSSYKVTADEQYGTGGYAEYEQTARNVATELSRYKLKGDLVLYSGRKNISDVTGGSSTLAEGLACTGKTFTSSPIMSTSMLESVAVNFTGGLATNYLFEIYAPKDMTIGADVSLGTAVDGEEEVTIANGVEFKVIDSGIRYATDGSGNTVAQRFMKLALSTDKGDTTAIDEANSQNMPRTIGAVVGAVALLAVALALHRLRAA